MMRRLWVLAVGLGVLPGCLHRDRDSVPPGVLAGLVARPAEPASVKPLSTSPYDARATMPAKEESQATAIPQEQTPATAPLLFNVGTDLGPPPPPAPAIPPGPMEAVRTSHSVSTTEKAEDNLVVAFRCFREGRPAEGMKQLKAFEPARRDILALLLPLAGRLAEVKPKDYSVLLDQLEDAIQAMRARSALSLEKVCFCRTIERFGVYEPLPSGHVFAVGSEGRPGEIVRLYLEVENFTSRRSGAAHETALACTMVLKDKRERIVWRQDIPVEIERTRSPRRDCYLPCRFYVPARLPVGDYTLTIQVTDLTGVNGEEAPPHRTASRSLEFHAGG